MPADSKTDASPKQSKPITRSSLRQSLNLASVGKAFADVISKDGREASKNAKKTKDARRSSVASVSALQPPAAPRASMGDVRPSSQISSKRTGTPDSKSVTRRRVSASYQRSSSDEQPSKTPVEPATTPQPPIQPRSTTLRPRNLNATSALPKYRPKSTVLEVAKPPSPVRAGTRRRLSTSDDEKKEQTRPAGAASASPDKMSRPISPLPQRAALKVNLTNSLNVSPPSTPSKAKVSASPSFINGSPTRPTKIVKTTPGTSTSIPRAPSSSTSSLPLQHTPRSSTSKVSTPKPTGRKAKVTLAHAGKSASITPSNGSTHSPMSRDSPSPLARRHNTKMAANSTSSSSAYGNMSYISEGANEDDYDDDDVAMLLAPVAMMGAPTPAMPRIQNVRRRIMPQTPTRPNLNLPGRGDMSYLSPLPPNSEGKNRSTSVSSSSLRPPRHGEINAPPRGSIMSWEQLAKDNSVTIGEDEFGRMLADIPAPFRSGAASPSLSSQMSGDPPDSPILSAIDSPGGYGSISQVLLPDVTPSPAINHSALSSRFSLSPDVSVSDASTTTLLRLQLAAAENTAKERLYQLQAMEEEIYQLKQTYAQQAEEMDAQMRYMETQVQVQAQSQEHWRSSVDEERAKHAVELETRFAQMRVERDQAVDEALTQYAEDADKAWGMQLREEALKSEMFACARLAGSSWDAVHDACDTEMGVVHSDKAMLALFLTQLDQLVCAL